MLYQIRINQSWFNFLSTELVLNSQVVALLDTWVLVNRWNFKVCYWVSAFLNICSRLRINYSPLQIQLILYLRLLSIVNEWAICKVVLIADFFSNMIHGVFLMLLKVINKLEACLHETRSSAVFCLMRKSPVSWC